MSIDIKDVEVTEEFKAWFEEAITELFLGLKDAKEREFLTTYDLNNAEAETINTFALKIWSLIQTKDNPDSKESRL